MNFDQNQETFGNLAPLMNVVSIAGYLNPKLVDEDTVATIAKSTGTPEGLVECIVEAVDDVNTMIGNGEDQEKVLKNFSSAMEYLGSCCQKIQFHQPQPCNPYGISKIAFALHQEDVVNFDTGDLADAICSFVPANFDNMYAAVDAVKRSASSQPRKNFARQDFSIAAVGKNLISAASKALQPVKTAIANNPTAQKIAKTAIQAKDAVVKATPTVKAEVAAGLSKATKLAEKELPQAKALAGKVGKEAGQLIKDVIHSPFAMGFDSELLNVGRLGGQKVISKSAADFLNKVKGVKAFDLGNATLETDIIKSGVMNMKASLANAAKQLKKGEISRDYFASLTKDFQDLLGRNANSLQKIRGSSLDTISKMAEANKSFISGAADLTSKLNSGSVDANSFAKTFESMLKKTSGSFKRDSLYLFRNATDKGKAARDIIKSARSESAQFDKALNQIKNNFDQVEKLVKTELATAVPMATSQLGTTGPGKLLESLRGLPDKARQGFIARGLKSCEPAAKSINPLNQKFDAVIKDAKSVLGKTALVGIGTAIPAGLLYWGINADEDKMLSFMVKNAEAKKIEIAQLEAKINNMKAGLDRERGELAEMSAPRKSSKLATAYGVASMKNFALPAPLAAAAKLLLFPIAPAILIGCLSFASVAVVQDKLARIKFREEEVETELAKLAMKRNELNFQLAQIEKETKRFHMGTDYLGLS